MEPTGLPKFYWSERRGMLENPQVIFRELRAVDRVCVAISRSRAGRGTTPSHTRRGSLAGLVGSHPPLRGRVRQPAR